MKQLVLFILLWQSYLIPAAGDKMKESPVGLKNAFYSAVNNKDKEVAIKAFARLQLLIVADADYFNQIQAEYFSKLHEHFINQIVTTFDIDDISSCMLQARKQEISSLITKIEKNQLHDDWIALIGKLDHKPLNNLLRWHRIKFLKKLKEYYDEEG